MSFNVLRHVMKFRNSAVLRLRIQPHLRLDYFCKNILLFCILFQNVASYALHKLKRKVNKVAVPVEMLKIFILFHNLLLFTVTSFIYFSIDDRFILIY